MIWLCDSCYDELLGGKEVECFTDSNVFLTYCTKCCVKVGTRHLHYPVKDHKHRWTLDSDYDGNISAFCNEFMCDAILTYSDIDEIINKEG